MQHVRTRHDAARRTTTHHNTKQGTLTEGLTKSSHRTAWKEPDQPASHTGKGPLHARRQRWRSTNTSRRRKGQTRGHTKQPGTTAHPAEPERNPAGRGAEPNVYITNPTHGAGARPGKTQPPTANRKTTQNANQCVRQPRDGRGRNRQTPSEKRKKGGGGENGPQPPRRRPTPQEAAKPPTQTAPKTGPPKGAPGDHPAKTGNTKPRTAAHCEKGHPKHADTHHAGKEKKTQNSKQRGPEEKEWEDRDHETQDRDNQRPTPQSPKRKKHKREGGGAHPTNGNTRTPLRHRRPPRKDGGKQGTRTTARVPQQYPPKERRGAAQTWTPTHMPTPHTRAGNGGEQEERAHSHARPKTLPRTGGVQAETQTQPQTPRTQAGKRGGKPQPVPKYTHPRPQPGLAGLPKPKPKHNRDPSTNATQQ